MEPTWEKEIPVVPMGKPRMTRRDKWAKRPCVLRYYEFKDRIREFTETFPRDAIRIDWVAYLPIPKSWSKKKKEETMGGLHRSKPDRDNIDKAILDAILKDDSLVAQGTLEKRWDDSHGPRIILKAWKS